MQPPHNRWQLGQRTAAGGRDLQFAFLAALALLKSGILGRAGGAAGQCWARGGLCTTLPFTIAVLPAEKGFTSYVCGNQPSKSPKLPA